MLCCVLAAEYGMKKIIVTYETQEHAQRAATILGDSNDQMPRVSPAPCAVVGGAQCLL